MPNCCTIEILGKCRFIFYDKSTGEVLDVGSGGGAGATLTYDDFIVWRFNDLTAPDRIGCIPFYFNKLGITSGMPTFVDLDNVDTYIAASRAWNDVNNTGDKVATKAAFEEM